MRRLFAAAVAAMLFARPVLAQQHDVTVIVRDSAGRALADVELSIPSLGRRTMTDSLGRARFLAVDRGSYYVRARRVGYEMVSVRLRVDDDTPSLLVSLKPRAVLLDTVRIAEKCPWRGFSGFACRERSGNGGLFLDHVAIDSSNVDDVAKLFYDRPGFKVLRRDRTGIPYVTGQQRCLVLLVNGLPANGTTNRAPMYAREVIAVEAYANPKQVPKDYEKFSWAGRIPCGLVNYWTSTR